MDKSSIKEKALETVKNINKDFNNYLLPKWNNYIAVSIFKSVRRAIRRGHVDLVFGLVYPNRPFNNKKSTPGRSHNQLKKEIYGKFKGV